MEYRKNVGKYVIIALVLVVLIAAAFFVIGLWEKQQGKYTGAIVEDGVLRYKGEEYVRKAGLETFLVLGLDKYQGAASAESHEGGVQADFLMLFIFDNDAKQCQAVQINRDTMTTVNRLGIGGVKTDSFTRQIALAYNYVADNNDKIRCRNTKDSVEALLHGVKVDHYLSLTMDSVAAMNDFVGGVELTVLDDFTGIDDALVKGQKVTLKGEQALHYVRTRYGLEDSTNSTRMARQQQYIQALYGKVTASAEADEGFLIKLVDKVDDYVVYDSSDLRMQKFAEKFGTYEFLGITNIEGEAKTGEFMEFYPDEDALWKLVIEQFYVPVKDRS